MIEIKSNSIMNILVFFICISTCYFSVNANKQRYVTCGSVLKLLNTDYKVRLHSHDVKYGTGSGQQSVTGVEISEDVNSHWLVKGPTGKVCPRGEPVKCGATIRLEHLTTHKNLHSHHFQSPLSGGQEVSAYGNTNGEGDSGDHWEIICSSDFWERSDSVMLKHVDTDVYLSATGQTYGRPINGQIEIAGSRSYSGAINWKAAEGLFLHAPELDIHSHHPHTEL